MTAARRALPLLGVLLLLMLPTVAAAPASVLLTAAGQVWNGESRVEIVPADAPREVAVWVPAGARVQAVLARVGEGALPTSWSAAGDDALLVGVPGDATAAIVRFDIPDRRPYLAHIIVSDGIDVLRIGVDAHDGRVAESPQATFVDGLAERSVTPGERISIKVVDAGRVGELPLLLTLAGMSVLVLAATLVWHRVRPPLGGKPAQKLLEHLGELQARLLPPALLFAFFNLFYFTSGLRIDHGLLLPTWGTDASISARAFEALTERLVPVNVQLVVLRPADAVLAQVGMCLFLAFATILPLLVYEIAAFIGPGLEPRERGIAMRVLPLVTGLFLTGALLAYLIMAPLMISTLYDYAPGIGATSLLGVGELVSFALLVILALGVAFELPVVMYVLARIGLVKAKTFGRYVRHAILAIVIAAGLITPDPSVVSQLLLAVPIVLLYLLGIGAAALGERAAPSARS